MMSTLATKNLELAVYGYIKRVRLFQDIPDVIKDLIVEFAKFHFNWKQSKSQDGYKFNEEDPTRITYSGSQYWTFLAMNNVLSLYACSKFEWESEMVNPDDEPVGFQFGFVEHPLTESVKEWDVHFGYGDTKYMQFGVYVSSGYDHFKRRGRPHKDGNKIIGNK